MTLYERLNQIHRALDIYNFPHGIPFSKQLQSIRVLHEHHRISRQVPRANELQSRLVNLAYEIYAATPTMRGPVLDELMDTALEMGVRLPALETQQQLLRQYDQHLNEEPVKDIYSLQAIVSDRQNVHHTSINEHVKQIVQQIVADYPPRNPGNSLWTILKSELCRRASWQTTNQETLKFINENTCTFTIGITLKQLILSVFLWIAHQPDEPREQLYQRLNEELHEMHKKCSTGHLSRLINVLQGFSDRYTIQIDSQKEIQSFVYNYLTKQLQEAPEIVQDGMVDQTEAFRSFVFAPQHQHVFVNRFGTEHATYIDECVRKFIGVN